MVWVTRYHHYDAQGNTRLLTDGAGTVTDTFVHDAWGNEVARTGTTKTPFTWNGRWGYYRDEETDTYQVRRRPYRPTIARFTSRDPLSQSIQLHPRIVRKLGQVLRRGLVEVFVYVGNNPTNMVDPSGLLREPNKPKCPFDKVVKRKCGIESFCVTWKEHPSRGGREVGFEIDVVIVFKKGGDFDPRCCEYAQNQAHVSSLERPGVEEPPLATEDTFPLHDDGYSRDSDRDFNKDLADPSFKTGDRPGWQRVDNFLNPTDLLSYAIEAEQIVYSPGDIVVGDNCCIECDKKLEVAKRGPHTAGILGVHRRAYIHVPWSEGCPEG